MFCTVSACEHVCNVWYKLIFCFQYPVLSSFNLLAQWKHLFTSPAGISLFIYAEKIFWLPLVSSHFLFSGYLPPSSSPPSLLLPALQVKEKYSTVNFITALVEQMLGFLRVKMLSLSHYQICIQPVIHCRALPSMDWKRNHPLFVVTLIYNLKMLKLFVIAPNVTGRNSSRFFIAVQITVEYVLAS